MSSLAPARSTALEGDLEALPVAELLQFFHLQGKGGVLSLNDPKGQPFAAVYYEGRDVVHAICGGVEGPHAVYGALRATKGRFEFCTPSPGVPRRTVKDNVQNLILEGLRRLEGGSPLSLLLPADEQPLYLAPDPPQDDIRLTAKEWRILSLVNGKRSIAQMIQLSRRPADEVRSILGGLLTADLVLTERDDRWMEEVLPVPGEGGGTGSSGSGVRYAASTLLGTLILKKVDGKRTLRTLFEEIGVAEERFLDDFRLLVRHGRVALLEGHEHYRRWVESA